MNTLVIPGPDTKSIAQHMTRSATSVTPAGMTSGTESLKSTSVKTPPLLAPGFADSLLRAAQEAGKAIGVWEEKVKKTFESASRILAMGLLPPCHSEMDPYNGFWPERDPADSPERVIGAGDRFLLTVVVMNSLPLPSIRMISDAAYYQLTVPSLLSGDEVPPGPAWEAGLLSGHQYTFRADEVMKNEHGFHWARGKVTEVWHPHGCSPRCLAASTVGSDFFVP